MKKLAIPLVVLLMLGGAGGGWWFFLREPPDQDSAEAQEETYSLVPVTQFLELDPLILPVIREGQVTVHVTTVVAVELSEAVIMKEARSYQRKLKDSLLTVLHGLYGLRYVQDRGYDLPIVRTRVAEAAAQVLGADVVKSVVIKNIDTRSPAEG